MSYPPLGCLPSQITLHGILQKQEGCITFMNEVASQMNVRLKLILGTLERTLPNATFAYLNSYDLLLDVVQNPTKFGKTINLVRSWFCQKVMICTRFNVL